MNIILTTLNARYAHTSIALRYLYANLKEYKDSTTIQEYTINDNIHEIAEKILISKPSILGIGVYIWNSLEVFTLINIIKKVSPETIIILGGPEVTHKPMRVDFSAADYILEGEGEITLYNLITSINNGIAYENKRIPSIIPDVNKLELPYVYYTDHDIKNRVLYVEASRGCPFECEFCLSSVDKTVRGFDINNILDEFNTLWNRGARNFKFIDRTFNINIDQSIQILDFFLGKNDDFLVHFEVIPEQFPDKIREKIKLFKPGTIQLEVGIQTLNTTIADRIHRNMNFDKIKENLTFLENETNAHLHVDLIIGLPGESIKSFADNLNKLASITQCEIQLGVLKKLSGTTINRHDIEFKMIYSDQPPYEILENRDIPYLKLQILKRFTRYWDLSFNSGNFKNTIKLLWEDGDVYSGFYNFSEWIYNYSLTTYQISLNRLAEYFFIYLTTELGKDKQACADILVKDLMRTPGRKIPGFLRDHASFVPKTKIVKNSDIGKRQARHKD